jgi:hypothetical protein
MAGCNNELRGWTNNAGKLQPPPTKPSPNNSLPPVPQPLRNLYNPIPTTRSSTELPGVGGPGNNAGFQSQPDKSKLQNVPESDTATRPSLRNGGPLPVNDNTKGETGGVSGRTSLPHPGINSNTAAGYVGVDGASLPPHKQSTSGKAVIPTEAVSPQDTRDTNRYHPGL